MKWLQLQMNNIHKDLTAINCVKDCTLKMMHWRYVAELFLGDLSAKFDIRHRTHR